ncbi:diglucosylglycerate octanoyltransferase [Actinokineospora iranica]|uniref:Lysophospholipase L1 n=1 Tax=Actinokineospora iranica TaxID=1271860 RepID=A0A1G6VJC9_9PSEU|nr:diglucosylglycerate octanoyltransferase [Actinokineospora iranica]SDD52946.1 Lysophospholipase L1 [Actinokineospora iranica]
MASPTVLMFGDSLTFHGPDGPHPADDPRLWPNLAAAAIGGSAELFAGFGWTARDAYWSLVGDPRVWAQLPNADVLVLAVGGMDTLPSPLPTYLRQGIRYLRPDGLRRCVRQTYLSALPWLARATRGKPVALPAGLTVRYLDETLVAVRALRPDLPAVAILPGVHRSQAYGYVHTARDQAVAQIRRWADSANVSLLDLADVVGEHVLSGHGNVDGIHWGWRGHELAGKALAEVVGPLLDRARGA